MAKVAIQGGGPNYLGKQPEVKVPRYWKSSPDHPDTELAYITEPEKEVLIALNMHGGLENGKPNKGPKGIISLQGDMGSVTSDGKGGHVPKGKKVMSSIYNGAVLSGNARNSQASCIYLYTPEKRHERYFQKQLQEQQRIEYGELNGI